MSVTRAGTIMGAMLLGLALAACGGARLAVRDASSREIAPPSEGRARVVLAAPDSFRDVINVVDERGAHVAQLGGRTFTTLEVEPGTRRFYALVGANAYVVGGTVEPGRTYWVVAETPFARSMRWVAWAPGCDEDASVRVARARAVELDREADPASIARQLGNVPQRMLEADRELESMSDDFRRQRELQPVCAPAEAAPAEPAPAEAPATE